MNPILATIVLWVVLDTANVQNVFSSAIAHHKSYLVVI